MNKYTRYEKYDIAFGVIADTIIDGKFSRVDEVKKALQKLNDLVHREYPTSVEYSYVSRDYQDELVYENPNCSECGHELKFDEDACYCQYCGQRISWELEEDGEDE